MAHTRREFIKTTTAAGAMFGAIGASRLDASQAGHTVPLPTQRSKALMEMFGLKYPIFEAPHGSATCPELAIAVSNAGAMGALAGLFTAEGAHDSVSKVRSATKSLTLFSSLNQCRFRPRWTRGHQSCSSRGVCRRRR